MRTIRFRAWDKTLKEMCEIQEWVFGENGVTSAVLIGNDWEQEKSASEFELMQYTGLLDRNGKEIYEGDIVKDNFGHWEGMKVEMEPDFFHDYIEYDLNNAELEIIGNIWENGDLLK
jgi:uncharacterized phage protein (TIGR01671 family)